jgi:hypothetical protein
MREVDREISIKRKKLVNKTTLMTTLLIAATLILSGAVTGITIDVNENIEDTVITDGEIGTLDVPSALSYLDENEINPELTAPAKIDPRPYTGSTRGDVVWDNDMGYVNLLAAQYDVGINFDSYVADDFHFEEDTIVADVHWIGGYWNPYYWTGAMDWCISFMNDDGTGNAPDSHPQTPSVAGPFCFTWAQLNPILLEDSGSSIYYELSTGIPPIVFTGCEKYWVAIWAEGAIWPQSGMGAHTDPITLHQATWGSDYFGLPFWTNSEDVTGAPYDLAFQLTTAPDNDVGVTEIKHPITGDFPGCPCIPVEVTVENFGYNDQFGVDVNIEIKHFQWCSSFEEFQWDMWEIEGGECEYCFWQFVPLETSFPGIVTPPCMDLMAELYQSGCDSGVSTLTTTFGTDFSCKCNPRLSFEMWHDEYGSDDYLNIMVSTTGPAGPWTQVAGPFYRNMCEPGCPPGWETHVVDLSAYAHDGMVWFQIEGHCEMPASGYNLHIDCFKVYDLEYAECTEVDIPAFTEVQVEFPCWTPCKYGVIKNEYWTYDVTVCTKLDETCVDPKDEVPDNNCLTDYVTIYFPCFNDVAAVNITSPHCAGPHKAGTFEMKGVIKNTGQFEQCCFPVELRVQEKRPMKEIIFFDDFTDGIGAWSIDNPTGNWRADTAYGGTGSASGLPGMQFYWIPYGFICDSRIYTPMIDTTGFDHINIEFDHLINNYFMPGIYTLQVETSSDGSTWTPLKTWANPDDQGATHEEISTDQDVGGAFYLGFRFFGGNPWDIMWWNIDDVKITREYLAMPLVYSDEFCVEVLPVCTEMEIQFKDWTPVPPDPCFCGEVEYLFTLETLMCTEDQNDDNDRFYKQIKVEFMHDVAVKGFTSPCPPEGIGDGVIYSQGPDGSSAYTSDKHPCYEYKVFDDFDLGVDPHEPPGYAKISDVHWWGIARDYVCDPCGDECWFVAYDGCLLDFNITFYEDNAGVPGAVLAHYPYVSPTCTDTGVDFAGYDVYLWEYDLPAIFEINTAGPKWLSIQSTDGPGSFLWHGSWQGNWMALQEDVMDNPGVLVDVGMDMAFNLTGPGPGPGIDCYIPCGEHDICVIIKNLGTYLESVIVLYEIYEVDPETGDLVLVDSGEADPVEIEPCGTEQEVCLPPYVFDPCGLYFIWVWAELADIEHPDCEPCDNFKGIGVGVDCCPPTSCHDLNPVEPDGENNWYTSPVQVHLYGEEPCTCCDVHSGVKEIVYILNGVQSSVSGSEGTFTISEDGVHHVEYYAVDNVGHEEIIHHSFEVAIDTTDPTVELIYTVFDDGGTTKVEFTALASDETSGMNRVEFFIGSTLEETVDSPGPYKWEITWQSDYKTKTFYAYAYDNAGNADSDDVYGGDIPTSKTKDTQSSAKTTSRPLNLNRVLIRGI